MKLIGLRRALILASLLCVNLIIAAIYFLQIDPMRADAEQKLAGLQSAIADENQKISTIKSDLQTFKNTLPQYQELEKKGFLSYPDRFKMSRNLDEVRKAAELQGFSFTIADQRKVNNADADAAQMQVLANRITVSEVVSLVDSNFYDFVDRMDDLFPIHTRVQSFEISRKDPLNQAALDHIVHNEPVDLISAKASFDWVTIVSKQAQSAPATPGGL
jgi:hypothetical protein